MAFLIFTPSGTLPQKTSSHVIPLPGCDIFPQLQHTWARQIRRFFASHTECAVPAIDLALYVAPVVQFLVFPLSLIILSEVVLALHKAVVALVKKNDAQKNYDDLAPIGKNPVECISVTKFWAGE
jgi:hypothetical protein